MGRSSELVDPAIANVDHALLVFALDNPPVRGGRGEGRGGGADTTGGGRRGEGLRGRRRRKNEKCSSLCHTIKRVPPPSCAV